jgi:hypothetical protein
VEFDIAILACTQNYIVQWPTMQYPSRRSENYIIHEKIKQELREEIEYLGYEKVTLFFD